MGIGVDVGGTKIAAGLVAPDGAVTRRARRDTPAADAEAIAAAIADAVAELDAATGQRDAPVGVGAAGYVDLDGTVRTSPNLPGWRDEPLRARLLGALGRDDLLVVNDADAAAWGEHRCGGGEGMDSLVMVTVGTGVGGGIVVHDRLLRGANGAAGEIGHIIVDEGGPECGCGNLGCLEAHASGTAIGRKAREALAAGRVAPSSPLADGVPTGADVTAAARRGDPDARAVLADAGGWLGVGLATLGNALDPPVFVVGGGAMEAGELLLAPAREAMAPRLLGDAARPAPPVRPSALGSDGGMIGAALLAADVRAGATA